MEKVKNKEQKKNKKKNSIVYQILLLTMKRIFLFDLKEKRMLTSNLYSIIFLILFLASEFKHFQL